MNEVEISREARADLEEIRAAGVEQFGDYAAECHLESIRQSFAVLAEYPFAGQERPEFRRNIRSVSRRPHRILYIIEGELITIIRILHQARDVAAALSGES